eukprot:TRINITY_DN20084_c0_g1_i3.p1 TRINITY_DN20084_c0_g1~~TRINITY_DN20084_c0_g1_i3.p1  ORF type:complete len:215 (-),score=62.94 TRINITY_DN20084_c0_g1_i3:84-653(-)
MGAFSSRLDTKKVLLSAAVLGSSACAACFFLESRRQAAQIADQEKQAADAAAAKGAEVRQEALEKQQKQQQQKQEEPQSGCGRKGGTLGGWQGKANKASEAVAESLLALRGGSMSVRNDLRSLQDHLANLETVLQDAIYCTPREGMLTKLMEELEPLYSGGDACALLTHPLTGEGLRQKLISALEDLDD